MNPISTSTNSLQLYAATFTPTKLEGGQLQVNKDLIPAHLDVLREAGCAGIFVGGTNGLGLSTGLKDRMMLMTEYARERGTLDMIAHIGSASEADMQCLARCAADLGVPTIAVTFVNPFYKPQTISEAVGVLSRVASAAPDTALFLYHYPNLTGGENMDMPALIREASARIKSFAGIKLTSANISPEALAQCKEAADACGKVIGFGVDEEFDKAVQAGYNVFIGSTFNLQASLFHERFLNHRAAAPNRPLAVRYQEISMALISLLYQHETAKGLNAFLPRAHQAMHVLGGVEADFGSPLPPLRSLDPQEGPALVESLIKLDVLNWSNAVVAKRAK